MEEMLSTYCGSMTQEQFREHIETCGVCWEDAQSRTDLDFDAGQVSNPNDEENPN
jgi:hypothetical protein